MKHQEFKHVILLRCTSQLLFWFLDAGELSLRTVSLLPASKNQNNR
jgi:hypothetical protein